MLFNSYGFIFLFLPITVSVFFLIGKQGHHRIALSWLVVASLFFYAWWNPVYLGLLLFSIVFNYGCGVALSGENLPNKKMLLFFGVSINLLLLAYYKYASFLVESVNYLVSSQFHFEKIMLPLAISFFTFQQVAYLVDAYYGKTREYNFLHYTLFVSFFPQLIAGPIVHHRDMLPQFAKQATFLFNRDNLNIGFTIFIFGLFKKVVIADSFAAYASPVFIAAEQGESLQFFQAWEGAVSYTLQLYFDFSGYSDMAIGLGRIFGIKLPLNFNAPYQAYNIIDFWRRWHITLSNFLREYLYFPLGGNRKGSFRRYMNLLITMLLGGLWHGAGWTFVIWGGLHGMYLIINHLWRKLGIFSSNKIWMQFISRNITLFAVMIAWIFFRAETLDGALTLLQSMVNLPNTLQGKLGGIENLLIVVGFSFDGGYIVGEHYIKLLVLLICYLVIIYWPTTQQLMENYQPALDNIKSEKNYWWKSWVWKPTARWSLMISLMTVLSLLHLGSLSEFLYFQF